MSWDWGHFFDGLVVGAGVGASALALWASWRSGLLREVLHRDPDE
jgi:hypothetical protein